MVNADPIDSRVGGRGLLTGSVCMKAGILWWNLKTPDLHCACDASMASVKLLSSIAVQYVQ